MEAISPSRRLKHSQSFQDDSPLLHGRDLQSQQSPRLSRRKTTPFSFQLRPVFGHETTRTAATVEWAPRVIDWGTSSTLRHDSYLDESNPDPVDVSRINCRFCLAVYDRSQWQESSWFHWFHFHKQSTEACTALFHGECSSCSSFEEDASHSLCDFCSHLRLRHLLSCTPESFVIKLKFPVEDISIKDESCLFCRMVKTAIDRYGERRAVLKVVQLARVPEDLDNALITPARIVHLGTIGVPPVPTILAWDPSLNREGEPRPKNVPDFIADETWNIMKSRLEQCITDHSGCVPTHPRSDVSEFRLIDVQKRRLVKASVNDEFIALSYVWGKPTMDNCLQATRSSVPFLEKDGSLTSSNLPQTVEDALHVCARLGERHLWVDRLCIVQDGDSMQHQIDRMATIYSSAKLVIIDSSGNSTDYGLSGVSRGRQVLPKATIIHGLEFHSAPLARTETTPDSVWGSRGWTFQEGVLAVRRLFFSPNQICYECCSDTTHESKITDLRYTAKWNRGARTVVDKMRPDRDGFGILFSLYSERSLTYQSDTCNAFSGIIEAIYGTDNSWFGIPYPSFDEALLWHPIRRPSRWPGLHMQDFSEDVSFPTLSWASISGPKKMDIRRSYGFGRSFCGALVSWTKSSSEGTQTIRSSAPVGLSDDWREAMAIAWTKKCIESTCQLGLGDFATLEDYRQHLFQKWPTYEKFWDDAFSRAADSSYDMQLCSDLDHAVEPEIWKEMIQTRAQCASFGLDLGELCRSGAGATTLSICDAKGRKVGTLWRRDPRVQSQIEPFLALNRKYEFIAVSVHLDYALPQNPWGFAHLADMDLDYTENTLRPLRGEIPPRYCVAVILVRRKGLLARRMSIGFICLRDWIDANPVFKDIIFE